MNTVNSQNLEAQVIAINSAPTRTVVADKASAEAAPVKKPAEVTNNGQKDAASGNVLPNTAVAGEVDEQSLEQAITKINSFVQQIQRDLQFSVDDESGRTVIKVIDSESKEVIRQIPEEVLLKVAHSIEDSLEGTLLEVKV